MYCSTETLINLGNAWIVDLLRCCSDESCHGEIVFLTTNDRLNELYTVTVIKLN
jgi:hypothetical protein